MALSKDIRHYEDLRPVLDRALSSAEGIRITCPTRGKAINMQQRIYKLRVLDRERTFDVYEYGNPLRGASPYDNLAMELEDNVLIIRHATPIEVEDL